MQAHLKVRHYSKPVIASPKGVAIPSFNGVLR